jgi:tRNA G18 (ribose-2'-O)-methylase SpoU
MVATGKIEVGGCVKPHHAMTDDTWDETRLAEPTLLKYNVHTPLQSLPTEKVKQFSEATALPLALMLYNLNGDMNIGMSIRTAVILGCSDVWIVGKKKYDRRPEVGAKNYIRLHRQKEIDMGFFAREKLIPILIEQGGKALEDFSFRPYLPGKLQEGWKVVFVLGSESFGLPMQEFRTLGAPIVSISQYGVMRSLNVSIAASIILYEYCKQWRAGVCI